MSTQFMLSSGGQVGSHMAGAYVRSHAGAAHAGAGLPNEVVIVADSIREKWFTKDFYNSANEVQEHYTNANTRFHNGIKARMNEISAEIDAYIEPLKADNPDYKPDVSDPFIADWMKQAGKLADVAVKHSSDMRERFERDMDMVKAALDIDMKAWHFVVE